MKKEKTGYKCKWCKKSIDFDEFVFGGECEDTKECEKCRKADAIYKADINQDRQMGTGEDPKWAFIAEAIGRIAFVLILAIFLGGMPIYIIYKLIS